MAEFIDFEDRFSEIEQDLRTDPALKLAFDAFEEATYAHKIEKEKPDTGMSDAHFASNAWANVLMPGQVPPNLGIAFAVKNLEAASSRKFRRCERELRKAVRVWTRSDELND